MGRTREQSLCYCKSKNYASGSLEESTAIDAFVEGAKWRENDIMEKAEKWFINDLSFLIDTDGGVDYIEMVKDFKKTMSE